MSSTKRIYIRIDAELPRHAGPFETANCIITELEKAVRSYALSDPMHDFKIASVKVGGQVFVNQGYRRERA